MNHPRIGFLGAGRMATALAKGLINRDFTSGDRVLAADPVAAARDAFTQSTGARTVSEARDVPQHADWLIVAVKPQAVPDVLDAISDRLTAEQGVVSIAAGVPIATLEQHLPAGQRVVRVMPNTPALVGAGASAFSVGSSATDADGTIVRQMLEAVGQAWEVPESLLDAVTGLSGSGPAYVFQIIEALSDAGVRVGLPRDVATGLAAQTVYGAARMVLETGQHPAVLKDAVTSPGGTTIAGLQAMERGGVRADLIEAVVRATARSKELRDS